MIAFEIAVSVPEIAAAGIALNKANTALDEAAGEQQIAAELVRLLFVEPVKLLRGFGFLSEVHCLRGRSLHAKGQFVRAQASGQFGIARLIGGKMLVHLTEEFEFGALLLIGDPRRRSEMIDGRVFGTKMGALVNGGQKARTPIFLAAVDLTRAEHNDKGWEVFIVPA